jgi:hypothetical protein
MAAEASTQDQNPKLMIPWKQEGFGIMHWMYSIEPLCDVNRVQDVEGKTSPKYTWQYGFTVSLTTKYAPNIVDSKQN